VRPKAQSGRDGTVLVIALRVRLEQNQTFAQSSVTAAPSAVMGGDQRRKHRVTSSISQIKRRYGSSSSNLFMHERRRPVGWRFVLLASHRFRLSAGGLFALLMRPARTAAGEAAAGSGVTARAAAWRSAPVLASTIVSTNPLFDSDNQFTKAA
jgi:hypothetical protein